MILYVLSFLALAVVAVGLIIAVVSLFKRLYNPTQSVVDVDCNYLTSDYEQIKLVSKKYSNRIRGSVRLSQGRIKTMNEIRVKENNIIFPKP